MLQTLEIFECNLKSMIYVFYWHSLCNNILLSFMFRIIWTIILSFM